MEIDKSSDIAMYMQIYNNIADEIINGYLLPEERLPSRRQLSKKLGVAQRTVENAYNRLMADGYIVSHQGSGYYVSADNVWNDKEKVMTSRVFNFSTNGVETSKLPFSEWSKLLRATAKENSSLFQHGEKAGEWCLRKSIRRMLFRTQGIKCRTEQIIVGPGAEDLLREIVLLLGLDKSVLMNNYFYYRVHEVVMHLGISPKCITNGPDGIDMDELYKYKSGLLYQKPTHDLPTSVTLSEEKRRKIVEWLGDGRYVIEDSDDNYYQYGKRAKTLWELSEGKNVIYLGSFSKTIAPSMKIGFIVAPDDIVELWFKKKRFYSNRVSRVEQVTLSKFIDLGYYEKHVSYMRDVYRAKTEAFKKAINESKLKNICTITGDDAGMYCLMQCNIALEQSQALDLLIKNRVKLSSLDSSISNMDNQTYPPNTYVVGYGDMTITQIRDGVKHWEKAWEEYLD